MEENRELDAAVDWNEVKKLLDELYHSTSRLEQIFPGRKFTLDGHLVGSIGEVIAAYMFDLNLAAASNKGFDALARNRCQVEIKFTQGSSIALRHEPQHLIAMQRKKGGPLTVIYNGPGSIVWRETGKKQQNGQRSITITKLSNLAETVDPSAQLPLFRPAPI